MSKAKELLATINPNNRHGHEIFVEVLSRGFRVRLGCVTLALVDEEELFEWARAYIEDPDSFHSEHRGLHARAVAESQYEARPTATGIMGHASLGNPRGPPETPLEDAYWRGFRPRGDAVSDARAANRGGTQ